MENSRNTGKWCWAIGTLREALETGVRDQEIQMSAAGPWKVLERQQVRSRKERGSQPEPPEQEWSCSSEARE
ncbi:hypothetical protein XENOCAPTIV_020901 [Xenoophorus captivus]|uniref:Uncharacterized protein n=1 Tax=Xenoophorus captivus TaxID=1517983 RepID=A0ABV0QAZ0_9TELE